MPRNIPAKKAQGRASLLMAMSKKRITSGSHITELSDVFMVITEERYPPKANTIDEIAEAILENFHRRIRIYMKPEARKKWSIIYQLKAL